MKHHVLLKTIVLILLPIMFTFGFYVLFHSKVSPGGGFQGGAICATAFCLYAMIFSPEAARKVVSVRALKNIACIGCIIYSGVGMFTLLKGGKFLDYNVLAKEIHDAQFVGIMLVETGVQLTVFGALSLIFLKLVSVSED